MFMQSWSMTPQLTTGGRNPSPRKLRLVSPRIITGTRNVRATMIWLVNPGRRCRKIILVWLAPSNLAATA